MHQAFCTWEDFDESTKIYCALDHTQIQFANLGFLSEFTQHAQGLVGGVSVGACNQDGSIIFDSDSDTALFLHSTNGATTGANDVADLVLLDLQLGNARSIRSDVFTGLADGLGHFIENVNPTFASLAQSFCHDFPADGVDLGVHLECCDSVFGSRDLEVHVAKVIFVAQDVRQNGEVIAFLDEPHRNASYGSFERNTRIHQCQCRTANCRH